MSGPNATCRSCGADMIWAQTPNGRDMPLDAKPLKSVCQIARDGDTVEIIRMHDAYVSHFATCPNADKHRRGK